jgi:hypothetical protein
MKYRAMVLAAAGVLGSVTMAGAQQSPPPPAPPPPASAPSAAPNAAPAPPAASPPAETGAPAAAAPGAPAAAPGAPAAAAPGAQPAPDPGLPVQQSSPEPTEQAAPPPLVPAPPPVTFGGSNEDEDTVEDETEEDGPPLRWRGTTFTWNHAATTTMVGVGNDNIGSEQEFYGWAFNLRPKFFIIDLPKDKLTVSADIGMDVELTNSARTTDRRELVLQDLMAGLGYSRVLLESGGKEKGEYKTSGSLSARLRFPTSKFSYEQGIYLRSSLGLGLNQQIKLLGKKAAGLNNLTIGGSVAWTHLYSDSFVPVNPDLNRPRQNASGQTVASDVLGGYSFRVDSFPIIFTADLPIYRELQLSTSVGLLPNNTHQFGNDGGACDVQALTGCVDVPANADAPTNHPTTLFRVGLSYGIRDVVNVGLGYENANAQLGENGLRRDISYSPDAQFYLDVTANLDSIYSKATRRSKKKAPAPQQTASR